MGRRKDKTTPKSHTLPSSPTHSSTTSSDFEFTISLSPKKATTTTTLCPANDLFYKGQLLPLRLSPRISMVRTLLLASSSSTSSSDTTTSASRNSTGSSNDSHSSFSNDLILLPDCDSSRPSSVTEEEESKRLNINKTFNNQINIKKTNYFSRFSRFSSVFRKESNKTRQPDSYNASSGPSVPPPPPTSSSSSSVKRMSVTAKEVIRKYLKKVKPLYEKLSQKQQQKMGGSRISMKLAEDESLKERDDQTFISDQNGRSESTNATIAHSFSGNLRYPRRRRSSYVSSCPSSMRSSPSHSGILSRSNIGYTPPMSRERSMHYGDTSSMEELQSAIQGAIAHCKNSMVQNNKTI